MRPLRAAALGALIAALAGCSRSGSQAVAIDPALATIIPAGTNLLVGIRMDAIRNTAVYKRWLENRPLPGVEEVTKQTGIDPRKDLWEVLVAAGPSGSVALARGKFSQQGMEPRPPAEGAQRTAYRGFTITGGPESAVTFINSGTAAAGSPAMLRAVIDQRNSPDRSAGKALLEMAKSIPRGTQMWFVSAGGMPAAGVPGPGNLTANLGKLGAMIESANGTVNLDAGIKGVLTADCRNSEEAKKLHDTLRALLGMARMMTPESRRELRSVYDAVQVQLAERTVRVSADIPEQAVGALLGQTRPAAP